MEDLTLKNIFKNGLKEQFYSKQDVYYIINQYTDILENLSKDLNILSERMDYIEKHNKKEN